jgi:prepilin-type N-terminal cleavage/methylation domain-containing protein
MSLWGLLTAEMFSHYRQFRRGSKGFSLVEVLIAMLVAALFFIVVLQATTLGAYSKAQALETTQALSWIQQDVEDLRFKASNYLLTSLKSDAIKGDLSIDVASAEDFDYGSKSFRFVGSSDTTNDTTLYTGSRAIADTTITLSEPNGGLVAAHTQGELILIEPDKVAERCKATYRAEGLANSFRNSLIKPYTSDDLNVPTALDFNKTKTSTNKQFRVQRNLTLIDSAPFNSLQISYTIYPPEGTPDPFTDVSGNTQFVTEVIPDVAFYCQ